MSRIGNKVIVLPAGVELSNKDNVVTVKGPKGELTREFSKDIEIRVEGTEEIQVIINKCPHRLSDILLKSKK